MPRHPVADDGGELTNLQSEPPVFPRCVTKGVFVDADFRAVVTRIKTAVQSRLAEEIKLFAELRVEKKREARIEKIVDVTVNQPGRRLLEMVELEVNRSTDASPDVILHCGKRE